MVMPIGPGTGFIIRHAGFSLSLFEELFHPDALAGEFRQRFQSHGLLGVGDPAADDLRMVDFSLEHQPDRRSGFLMPLGPDAKARVLIDDRSFGSFAKLERSPGAGRQHRGNLFGRAHRIALCP